MTLYYLDSNAWQKYYIRETGSEEIAKLFTQTHLLACCSVGFMEVLDSIWKTTREKGLSTEQFSNKARAAGNDWTQFIQIHTSQNILNLATQALVTTGLNAHRALHVAALLMLQRINKTKSLSLILVSTDEELLAAAQKLGIITLNPTEEPITV